MGKVPQAFCIPYHEKERSMSVALITGASRGIGRA
ncbi:NAD(P)-dependent oxidoreductase, partial [Cronobacter sakazakii]